MNAISPAAGAGWYAPHSPLTDPERFAPELDALPPDVGAIIRVVLGLVTQPAPDDPDPWTDPTHLRFVADMLAHLREQDGRPFTEAREPARRLRGNCRNSAVLSISLLRQRGIPARKRTGFARYIATGRAIIHEVAECWDGRRGRWVLADADVPLSSQSAYLASRGLPEPADHGAVELRAADGFVTGGDAWLRCRSGRANPDEFQFRGGEGLRLVRQSLVQDLDGLNRVEVMTHDLWGGRPDETPVEDLTSDDLRMLDRAAELTLAADERPVELRQFYADSARGRSVLARLAEAGRARTG